MDSSSNKNLIENMNNVNKDILEISDIEKKTKKKKRKFKNLMKDILKSEYNEETKKKINKKNIEKQTGGGTFDKMPDRI